MLCRLRPLRFGEVWHLTFDPNTINLPVYAFFSFFLTLLKFFIHCFIKVEHYQCFLTLIDTILRSNPLFEQIFLGDRVSPYWLSKTKEFPEEFIWFDFAIFPCIVFSELLLSAEKMQFSLILLNTWRVLIAACKRTELILTFSSV